MLETGELQEVLGYLNGREEEGESVSVSDFEVSADFNYRGNRDANVVYEERGNYQGIFVGLKGTEEELEDERKALRETGYEFEVQGLSDIGNYTGGADFRSEYVSLVRIRTEDLSAGELEELNELDFSYDLQFDSPLTD